jgi:hypothetical protein
MGDVAPFALVVDDGDLDACCEVLSKLELDWLRESGSSPAAGLWPTELLISNRQAAARLAQIPAEERRDGTWLCVIDSRASASDLEALRALGVHFVIRRGPGGALDRELLRLLFLQIAYAGSERRGSTRMLCSHEVTYAVEGYRGRARLLDLSTSACRILTAYSVPRRQDLQVYLPLELDPQAPTAYPAHVVRSAPAVAADGRYMLYLILEFQLSRELHAKLEQIVKTQARSAAITELAPRCDALVLQEEDRRAATRHAYADPVAALTYLSADAPKLVRGHEISGRGMRIDPTSELSVGQNVVLALYRGPEQKPMMLQATVRRDDGERGLWVAFGAVEAKDRQSLNRLLAELPALERLTHGPGSGSGPIMMATIQAPAADPHPRPAA